MKTEFSPKRDVRTGIRLGLHPVSCTPNCDLITYWHMKNCIDDSDGISDFHCHVCFPVLKSDLIISAVLGLIQRVITSLGSGWLTLRGAVVWSAGIEWSWYLKTKFENLLGFKFTLYDEQYRISTEVHKDAWTHAEIFFKARIRAVVAGLETGFVWKQSVFCRKTVWGWAENAGCQFLCFFSQVLLFTT